MKSVLSFSVALLCLALIPACSSKGDGGDTDSSASDLGGASNDENGGSKVGFDVHGSCDGGSRPVGFFPPDSGGVDSGDATCPPGTHRCCTSSGFQCIFAGAACTMLDSACESTPPKVGFFGK